MATIQDVAKYAHVGVATVSRVLNESGYVRADTREKVMAAIRELDYTPNEMARNLYHKKTGIVAIIIPAISHPYFAEFTSAAEVALFRKGYQTMICNTWREQNYETYYLELLKKQRVDGIITGVHTLDIEQYKEMNHISGSEAMEVFSRNGLLDYLEAHYEPLHTQSRQWILEEIDELIKERQKQ